MARAHRTAVTALAPYDSERPPLPGFNHVRSTVNEKAVASLLYLLAGFSPSASLLTDVHEKPAISALELQPSPDGSNAVDHSRRRAAFEVYGLP